ncbi:MAG: TSUP family transporter [Thermoleophilaceae bacterium]
MSALDVAAAVAVMAGALIQSATGFGFALVAAPLLFAATSPEHAVGLSLVLAAEVNLLTLFGEGRAAEPLVPESRGALLFAVPGAVAGVVVLRSLSPTALQVAVTVGVLATLALRRVQRYRHYKPGGVHLAAAGLAAGALTTSTTTNGPPLVLYLLGRSARPSQVRDTLVLCFLGLSLIGALALVATGTFHAAPNPAALAALVPLVLAGHLAGRRLFASLSDARYETALTALLLATALAGLLLALL